MTKRGIAEILAPHYMRTNLDEIEHQIVSNEQGDLIINKSILDAFVLYSADELAKMGKNSKAACEMMGCAREAMYVFKVETHWPFMRSA
jgi:hypothetical protein